MTIFLSIIGIAFGLKIAGDAAIKIIETVKKK